MRIALFQMNIIWENKEENIKKIEDVLKKINVDLLLLPEMSLTGFSMNTDKTKENNKETVTLFTELSKIYKTSIGIGWVKDAGEKSENHYSIITPLGEILDYTKLHPFSFGGEDKYFQGGDKVYFCKLGEFNTSVLICYDLRFPEIFQKASKKADLIILPANWPGKRREHFNTLLKARAIENQCYIAGINCAGDVGDLYYTGDSKIINPDGVELLPVEEIKGYTNEEVVRIYDIYNDVKDYRENFPTKKDRREELYL